MNIIDSDGLLDLFAAILIFFFIGVLVWDRLDFDAITLFKLLSQELGLDTHLKVLFPYSIITFLKLFS